MVSKVKMSGRVNEALRETVEQEDGGVLETNTPDTENLEARLNYLEEDVRKRYGDIEEENRRKKEERRRLVEEEQEEVTRAVREMW